jgi:Xaa-Pro aminopeptidase
MLDSRLKRLRNELKRHQLEAILLFDPVHLRYYADFTGSDGALIVTNDRALFYTDSRYTSQAMAEVRADSVTEYRLKYGELVSGLGELGLSNIGFEASTLSVALFNQLSALDPDLNWVPLDRLGELRQIQDYGELDLLEHACGINAVALERVLPMIRPGVSEHEIALELEYALRCCGGEEKAFDFIVASGWRGAYPHGVASDKIIQAGELITIDFGTRKGGYYSDETVTLAVGEISSELEDIYACVLKAHDLALEALSPSIPARDVDRIARDHITECGYGSYFGHGLGHGIGLEVHESPTLSPRSEVILTPGMVFTIEPGIYIPELGGVRIEDTVLLTNDGGRCLTSVPKNLRSLAFD